MEREGDIIHFNTIDRKRCGSLPGWIPIEAMPGLFEDVAAQLIEAKNEISQTQSNQEKGDICLRAYTLQQITDEMLDVAGDEIIESQLMA